MVPAVLLLCIKILPSNCALQLSPPPPPPPPHTHTHTHTLFAYFLTQCLHAKCYSGYCPWYILCWLVYTMILVLFSSQTGARSFSFAYFGQGTGDIYLTYVRCTGRESRLLSCGYSTPYSYSCRHYEDAGVRCPGMTESTAAFFTSQINL